MARYLFRSLNILNGLLALAVAAVLHFAVIPRLNPAARISLPAVKEAVAPPGEAEAPFWHLPPADYAVISEQNLFHPERKIPQEKQPEKAVPKPDVVLYGTLIADGASYAFVEDKKAPYSTPGRGNRQVILKKGERLSGYTLRDITEDRIVLVKGEEKVVVMLDERGKKRTDASPAAQAATRTAAGGAALSSPAPPSPPRATPSSGPAAVSPGPGIVGSPTAPARTPPQLMPPPAPDAPSQPGIGGSGVWPPTRESVEQTRQKLNDAQRRRMEQLKRNP